MQAESIAFLDGLTMWDMQTGKPARSTKTDFAQRLIAFREAAGLSQRDIARQLGISQPSYANWERYNVALKPEQLMLLAKILGVTVTMLVEGQTATAKRGGPTGKVRQVFERVNQLSRQQQSKIVEVVEAYVNQYAKAS